MCDAIVVCGAEAAFIEYKGSTFTAYSKYSGDLQALTKEIDKKLVRSERKRKGLLQLADAISKQHVPDLVESGGSRGVAS